VRIDLYPSPGLENPLPLDCSSPAWRDAHLCFAPQSPFTVRDTAVVTPQGGPNLPDAVVNDPNAYVRLSTAYQLGMADGGTGVPGVRSPRLADTFRCVAAAPAA
jgi:hypothetical protein